MRSNQTLFSRIFAWNDRRRARAYLQQVCEERIKARLELDEANRRADRALRDAQRLEDESFRESFFNKRDPVHAGFFKGSAGLFDIKEPTPFVVAVPPCGRSEAPRLAEAA
jgi:hypothetical protein